jgi:hypothetical protein
MAWVARLKRGLGFRSSPFAMLRAFAGHCVLHVRGLKLSHRMEHLTGEKVGATLCAAARDAMRKMMKVEANVELWEASLPGTDERAYTVNARRQTPETFLFASRAAAEAKFTELVASAAG